MNIYDFKDAAIKALNQNRFPGAPYVDAGISIAIGVINDMEMPDNLIGGKMRTDDGDVFIIFGDAPRSDGSNIYGVYKTLSAAEQELELAELQKPWVEYHIEEFGLWG